MVKRQEVILAQHVAAPERFTHVIGVDEVGWGAIAGPLCVAAAVLPWEFENPGLKDSKRYTTDKSRKAGSELAKEHVLAYEVMFSDAPDILQYGPNQALRYLQVQLVKKLMVEYPKALIVVDGNKMISGINRKIQLALPKADARIPAVSAASIIAKVARDEFMINLSNYFPEWHFHKNKGYPTPPHLKRLWELGPTEYHRLNVGLVQGALDKRGWYEWNKSQCLKRCAQQ